MLSGIYNAVGRLVTPSNNQSRDDDEDEPSPLSLPTSNNRLEDTDGASSYSYPSSYSYQDASPATVDPSNIKTVTGTITQTLSTGYGLIDDDIVFTYDVVEGKHRPRVGTKVQVEAYRENAAGGWKARKVSLTLDWNVDDPNAEDPIEIQTIVGTITKVELQTGKGYINNTIVFNQDALAHAFKPYRGDWVEAELHRDPETQEEFAKNVRPLRHREFDGVVTHAYPGYGYIDNKIYFMFSNCIPKEYRPDKGDAVKGKAIESDQSKGRWRAIGVEKKNVYKR